MAEICLQMGWGYEEYMAQPDWFVELLYEYLKLKDKEIQKELKKIK